jgi:hypothetical protein
MFKPTSNSTFFEEWLGSCSDCMACTVADGMARTVSFVACTVPFVASVSNSCPCVLTRDVPCQYNPAWRKGTLRGVVEAGVRRASATHAMGPPKA